MNRESEKSDNVNMSEDVNKCGSVRGDDDPKSESDSETEDEKKNDEGDGGELDMQKDAEENELWGSR